MTMPVERKIHEVLVALTVPLTFGVIKVMFLRTFLALKIKCSCCEHDLTFNFRPTTIYVESFD
jgi:hypothetical protein